MPHASPSCWRPRDLPPECWTVSRRLLNPLESLERHAIVASLLDHDGSKVKAAEALGMSRATIYRKIHEYGYFRAASTIQTGPGAKVIGCPDAVVNVVPPSGSGRDQRTS